MSKQYFVYIMTNKGRRVLYTGFTSNLVQRVWQHKNGLGVSFTSRYKLDRLMYYEVGQDALSMIAREKQIKDRPRAAKIRLIESMNPAWKDLSEEL